VLAGALSAFSVLGNFFLMRYPGALLPETLFLSFVLLHAACILHSLRRPGSGWPLLAGAMLGCAILARPAGYALIFGLIWLPFAFRRQRWFRSCCVGGGVAAVILAACTGNYLFRGYFETQAFGGITLISKILPILPPQVQGFDPAATARTYDELRAIGDAVTAAATWEQGVVVEMIMINAGYDVLNPLRAAIAADPARWRTTSPYWPQIALNKLSWDFAREVILADPMGYARLVAHQVYGMWFVPVLSDAGTASAVSDLIRKVATFDPQRGIKDLRVIPGWAYAVKLLGFAGALLLSFYVMLKALFRPDVRLAALGYLAFSMHCYAFVVAGVEVAIPRYSLMMWPFQCAVVIGVAALWSLDRRALAGAAA
jgi:hypothetical protein